MPYYVGLLSAAKLDGAAHQRPQVDRVVAPIRHRGIRCGAVQVDFVWPDPETAISGVTFTATGDPPAIRSRPWAGRRKRRVDG